MFMEHLSTYWGLPVNKTFVGLVQMDLQLPEGCTWYLGLSLILRTDAKEY